MAETFSFFAFLGRMKYINRWSLMRNTFPDTLSQHSQEVAAVAYALAVIGNRRLHKNYDPDRVCVLGLFHDVPEILTGDMPTPVKYYNSGIKSAYDEVERKACERLLANLPEDYRADFEPLLTAGDADAALKPLVKAADKISALIKCVEERKAGNTEFAKAEDSARAAIEKMDVPEAMIFTEEFLPAFELTLDQL